MRELACGVGAGAELAEGKRGGTVILRHQRPPSRLRPVASLREQLARRKRDLDVLARVAEVVHDETDASQVLEAAIEQILAGLDLQAAWIFRRGEPGGPLRLAAARGLSPAYLETLRRDGVGVCLCPEVFSTGQSMQAHNTTECPRMPMIVDGLEAPVPHACVPLRLHGVTRGVLNIAARPGEPFDDEELRFFETVSRQISLAVERADHFRSERLFNREAQALARISKAIGGLLDFEAVLEAIGAATRELLEVDRVRILLGSHPTRLQVAHISGQPHPTLSQGQDIDLTAIGSRLQTTALVENRLIAVDDLQSGANALANAALSRAWDERSGLCAPLVVEGQPVGLLVATRRDAHTWTRDLIEVAEALAAQAAIAIHNARLYDQSRRAYEELKETQSRLIQGEKLATIGTFASGLAHEVRNPLNSMSLALSRLERRHRAADPHLSEEVNQIARVIREEIQRLDNLVGDFLLFSRTNRIQYRAVDLEHAIDEVLMLLAPEAASHHVTIEREQLSARLPSLRLDADKIKQVVINLVRNSIEAMPDGGTVIVSSGLVDGRARIVVRDTGPGLPEGIDVFQLFVTTKPQGTGLGLSIAQQIVVEHGGEILASSPPGEGATFSVTLPVEPERDQDRQEGVST